MPRVPSTYSDKSATHGTPKLDGGRRVGRLSLDFILILASDETQPNNIEHEILPKSPISGTISARCQGYPGTWAVHDAALAPTGFASLVAADWAAGENELLHITYLSPCTPRTSPQCVCVLHTAALFQARCPQCSLLARNGRIHSTHV